MTKKKLRVRDRFTFSLTGIPVAGSFGILPVIANDRIRISMNAKSESAKKARGADLEAPIPADALESEYA